MNDEWKIFVEYRPGMLATFIYISKRIDVGVNQFLVNGGNEVITVKTDAPLKNEVYFARVEDDYLLSLLVEALDKRGIKAPSQSFIEGKYEATNEHLQDLRKLIPKLADGTTRQGK